MGYGIGVRCKRALYDWGWLHPQRAKQFVVGVGNLTLGGTGKTTVSRFLARRMLRCGIRPAVVLRGYRRAGTAPSQLVSDGSRTLATPEEAGDEAYMLAVSTPGAVVAVGKKRERVCAELLSDIADAVILDDAFQYGRIAKDYEIALLDTTRPATLDRLFPAGLLREPPEALRRADAVWLTRADQADEQTLKMLREMAYNAVGESVVETRHRPAGLRRLATGEQVTLDLICGRPISALSSIGNPFSFEQSLRDLGAGTVIPIRFPDHHRYSAIELSQALEHAVRAGAETIVTTEKDAVKLPRHESAEQVYVLEVELEILSGGEWVERLLAWAEERARHDG